LVAAQRLDETWLYWLYALAALGAVLLGAGAGALSSLRLSRWAVKPLERFAADAAHEIRTPLTALRAELELLAEESQGSASAVGDNDARRESLQRACARVARLSELVERLLFLAQPTEKLHEGFETLSVADLVEQVASELPEADRARLSLELPSEGLVRGDLALLGSLISNALENAFKFAPEGPVVVRLEETPDVVLRVADHGPGVPPALRARVFEAFYRERHGGAPGHGLGLALIGHIARAHGGNAAFADPTSGAELVIRLPAWSQLRKA
jgi:two-component system OmpR family sensor kinase